MCIRDSDWTVGLYAFHQAVETHGVTEYGKDAVYWLIGPNLPNVPDALLDGYKVFNDSRIETDSYAVFGQLTWNITDRLHLTPGLRYTKEDKSGWYQATTAGGLVTTDPALITRRLGIARPQAYDASLSDDDLSGQVSLAYDVTDDVLTYASVARGYKSGGINMAGIPNLPNGQPSLTNAVVKPEVVTTYELGLKTQLFDRRVTANLAAYRTDVKDYQANVVDSGPGALRGYLANADQVVIQGVELDAFARPNRNLDLYANAAWTDAKYDSFTNGPCPLELIGASTVACDLSGKKLPGVSPWAASVGAEVHGKGGFLGQPGELYGGVDASYRSSYNSDASVSRYTQIDSYTILNLRAGFRAENGWEAFVWVKNALDENYLQFVSVQSGNSGLVIGNPGDPRTVGITLRARY